jgi:[CysO sulfur-carrier protein]-S-L-cysteine hydrolase
VLTLTSSDRATLIATCIRALPNEGCGLLIGTPDGVVREVVASANVADSAKVYEVEPTVLLRAYRRADSEGLAVIGVFHSHTHSEAYPSSTDIVQAPDPSWHYVLVSFAHRPSQLRSFRISNGLVSEEPTEVVD